MCLLLSARVQISLLQQNYVMQVEIFSLLSCVWQCLLKETVELLMQHILPGCNLEIQESIVTILLNSKGNFLLT
jgi:hypothetical protein